MAHTAPTPGDLKTRYPSFSGVADATVQYWLTDAERFVSTSWIEADYAPAIMAYAAHHMALEGLYDSGAGGSLPAGVTGFKSGNLSVQIDASYARSAAAGSWDATRFGKAFRIMQRRNAASVIVATPGRLPEGVVTP